MAQDSADAARRECALGFEAARRRDALFLARGFEPRAEHPANPWRDHLPHFGPPAHKRKSLRRGSTSPPASPHRYAAAIRAAHRRSLENGGKLDICI